MMQALEPWSVTLNNGKDTIQPSQWFTTVLCQLFPNALPALKQQLFSKGAKPTAIYKQAVISRIKIYHCQ